MNSRASVPASPGERSGSRLLAMRRRRVLELLLLALGLFVAVLIWKPPPAVPQPIAFNHRVHTEQLGLGCEFCHMYVTTGAHAGLPGEDTCGICHLAVQGDAPEAARVTELLTAGTPFRFNKLFRLPTHVNYTHRRHVGIGDLECANCHGSIATSERPPARPLVHIDMAFCLDCHRARGQPVDCVACHR